MSYLPVNSVAQPVVQQVTVSANNSVTATTVIPTASWDGTYDSTLNVAGIQVTILANQRCHVYVHQSIGGVTDDVVDEFDVYAGEGFSTTVQAVSAFFRVQVENMGAANATITVDSVLCPIIEAMPRALDEYGSLKTGVRDLTSGDFGYSAMVTPMQSLRVVQNTRLIGATFQGIALDTRYWTASLGIGGAVAIASGGNPTGEALISTGTTANNTTSLNSVRVARYAAGSQNFFRAQVVLPAVSTATGTNKRQWGALDTANGYWFEAYQANAATKPIIRVCTRSGTVDAAPITSFNGEYGVSYVLDNNPHTYEIYWTNRTAWFFIDGELLHTLSSGTSPLVAVQSLPIGLFNTNAGGNTSNNTFIVRVASIHRLGYLLTQPQFYYQSGTTAGVVIKSGVGNLHKVIIGSQATTAVITLYDNTAASGSVIFSWTYTQGAQANNQPTVLDFAGIPFSIGLTIAITTAASNVCVIYE